MRDERADVSPEELIEAGLAGRLRPGTEAFERFIDVSARRPSGEQMAAHYRDPRDHLESFDIALRALELTPDDRYLEIGFGGGQLLNMALRTARSAAGIDHSSDMLALASERNTDAIVSGRLQLVFGDVHRLPWSDDEFTCAAAVNMFFFVESPLVCLRELQRVLRSGGRLVIVTVAASDDPNAHGPWSPALRAYPAGVIAGMLREAGFAEASVEEPGGGRQVCVAVA